MKNILFITLIIIVAAFSRLLPHMHNFSPLIAISLFGAAYLKNTRLNWWLPLSATFLSDLALYYFVYPEFSFFYPGWVFQYLAYALIILAATAIFTKVNIVRIAGGTLAGAIIFYIVSNFGSWLVLPEYTKDMAGLSKAYMMGLPFFKGTFISTLLFSGLLFGAYYVQRAFTLRSVKNVV